ncbi:hypothetical protein [Bacillus atrophaeus]|uniref:Uncharacterized protein n=1 Tax=Bacillus atrophaeus (strain 1942) TaxID=720555 RepID=A0ABM5LX10_BACA1|nr:hypothetical protein [Bacillus atrophaeus]AMR62676.1 hypothetical protein A1D11_09780 [Bacillus subtilis subsp. globigii]ADP32464.1 hypothetical protein BATR1942_07625 [Bacillus atrophaeus 1942]AIK47530.1 hypothetical protein DJ95_1424 [Bacillus atrophaeus subsp. globigii]EIM11736.1 hypothetical protein UY9_05737 [Bacillus atrophaeus C89]KFK83696.1 hypothetical protein DK44_2212 [Bacillus atrophaeus]
MIKSIILPEENTKITVGKPISEESSTKVIAIYDYRDEPEEAFWVHLSNGHDLFVDNDEVVVVYE